MKILICTNSFEQVTNGPAKFANLILEINTLYREHEVHILTEDITQPNNLVHSVKLSIPFFLKPLGQVIRMFQYHNEAMRIRKSQFEFDVLVYNNAFIGLWSAIRFTKTIGMINDDNNALTKFMDVFKGQRYIKQFVFKQLEQLSIFFHKKIITNSKYLTSQLLQVYSGLNGKDRLMYKSVDTKTQNVNTENSFHSPIQILFVKNDFIRGGLYDLFSALSKVDFNFQLMVIGPPNKYFNSINKVAEEMKVNVRLMGPLSQEEVFSQLQSTDIFCVPSHKEALGVANMEAMAHGVAVISTHVGGIPEVLNEKSGWLVPVSDTEALRNVLNECVADKELRDQKRHFAYSYVKNFSKQNMFNRFLEITAEVYRV